MLMIQTIHLRMGVPERVAGILAKTTTMAGTAPQSAGSFTRGV
ncbi:MAG TPA: hypothetical protein VMM15_39755 [Bradyrhizobium sp.]|nr:hypothetical protein [Bradyrhizobium sp.]